MIFICIEVQNNKTKMDDRDRQQFEHQINSTLTQGIGLVETETARIQATDAADEAERRLDDVIENCIAMYGTKLREVQQVIKNKRPTNISSPTHTEDLNHWQQFSNIAAVGIQRTQTIFNQVLEKIREIVSNVLDWIRDGMAWGLELIQDAFNAVRNFIP